MGGLVWEVLRKVYVMNLVQVPPEYGSGMNLVQVPPEYGSGTP
jgi:hypothetical protein